MVCKKCGNQINDNALFCPKCGQKTDNRMKNMGVSIQPNTNNANLHNNVNSEGMHKKKHTVRTVILSVATTIVVLFGGLIWLGSQAPSSIETGGSTVPVSLEKDEISSDVSSQDSINVDVSSQDSINELLGYIDQAEEIVTKAQSDYDAVGDEVPGAEKFGLQADILQKLNSDLLQLQQQANSINDIDSNLENAGKEYFNMLCDSKKAHYEIISFFVDYFEFSDNYLFARPDDFGTEDHYEKLYTWFQSVKEGYLAINSCPSCLENEWKQYGETLDLNESIAIKEQQAFSYEDWLRLSAAIYMSNRYVTIEELQYDGLLDCLKGEISHLQAQRNLSAKLADEIHNYAELGQKERSEYEFEYVRTNKISLNYECIDTIYPSLYNTYDAFLIIKTGCASGSRKILVEAEIPGFTQKYKESFTLDSAYRAIYIKPPALTGDLDLTSAKEAQINVTVSDQDGTVIGAKTFPVTIKSKYDVEWYTDEYGIATKDNILCYLTPEAPVISELKRVAIDEIAAMTNGGMESFVGYQETEWNHYVGTYLQAAGIMRALYEMGVRYNADAFSISNSHQHVLFPEDVLKLRSGICIETSLVVASALQSANMHAFLVFPPGHAQVAVEVWNGTGEYFLIETTALSADSNNRNVFINDANELLKGKVLNSSPIQYLNAEDWKAYLSVEGTYLIDCDDSRILGLTPFAN